MNQKLDNSGRNKPQRVVGSIVEQAFGTPEEERQKSIGEVRSDLKSLGIDTEKGWESIQGMLQKAEGKVRLANARLERRSTASSSIGVGEVAETAAALIEQVKTLLALGGGNGAVFARKAESMPIEDLRSLRDQILRTASKAAKKDADKK